MSHSDDSDPRYVDELHLLSENSSVPSFDDENDQDFLVIGSGNSDDHSIGGDAMDYVEDLAAL